MKAKEATDKLGNIADFIGRVEGEDTEYIDWDKITRDLWDIANYISKTVIPMEAKDATAKQD